VTKHPVVIVGGGLSGLAAAVRLSAREIPVILFEQKPALGGRAYSFLDPTTGETIDNGQHVLIAGYERTMQFLEMIGTRNLLAVQSAPSILFHHPQRGFQRFAIPRLPSPFHLIAGVLRCNLFSLADRWRILRAGLSVKTVGDSKIKDLTVDQWLEYAGQSAECKRSFWEPLAVSIMNEHIATASALIFVRSLRKAFLAGRRNASLAIPMVGLSELYVEQAQKFITLHGGKVFCGADVVEVLFDGSRVSGVRLRGNEIINCSALILAVPNTKLASLLPPELSRQPAFSAMHDVSTSPIVSIHLWFETDAMPDEFVGLIGRRVQWVFNKRKLNKATGPGGHVSAVISAAHEFVGLSNDELIQLTMEDVRSAYPSLPERPTHAVVIREKRATFSCTPAVEQLRPSQKTHMPNLFLAGDWTDTGYPATIEGAITSAEQCANLVSVLIAQE
jgi:squalene-associated FAD-dependent desaturase